MNDKKIAKSYGNIFKQAYFKLSDDERIKVINCLFDILDKHSEQNLLEINKGLDEILNEIRLRKG